MIAGRRFEAGEPVWTLTGRPIFGAVTESGPNYIGLGPDVWIDPDLPRLIRLQPSRKTVLFNGALECRLYEYRMVPGGNRRKP